MYISQSSDFLFCLGQFLSNYWFYSDIWHYRLANQFRRENTDVVGDKPVKNDAGEMSMREDSKQKAWLEHYQRLLNVEFDWDPDHLSYQPPVEGPPIPVTIDMVKKAISQMQAGKAPGPSGIVWRWYKQPVTWAPPWSVTSQLQTLAMARHCLTGSRVSYLPLKGKGGCIGKRQLPRSQADWAGHRQFPVWLCPGQRHNRHNLCCQAAAREVSSCQQETLHGFHRPGEGFWSSTLEDHLVGTEKTCGGVDCTTGAGDVCKCAEPWPC